MATRQFPHPSAEASSFKVGDAVRWTVLSGKSPYVGSVTHIHPGINKVDVEFPVGGNQRLSPEELVLVPKEEGKSTVTKDTSYSSYDKAKSEAAYGKFGDKDKKMAAKVAAMSAGVTEEVYKTSKMASGIAEKFAGDVVEKLATDTLACVKDGMTDIQAYQKLYPAYAHVCSDGFMRAAIGRVYKEAFQFVGEKPQVIKWIEQAGFDVQKLEAPKNFTYHGTQVYRIVPIDNGEKSDRFVFGDSKKGPWVEALRLSVVPGEDGKWIYKIVLESSRGEASHLVDKVFESGQEQQLIKYLRDNTGESGRALEKTPPGSIREIR